MMKSVLSYLSGKSRLAASIVPLFPEHLCYCEPFCGALWVLFSKEPSKCEVVNDFDKELITFWRVIQNHLEAFLQYYKYAVTSRELFDVELKRDPELLTDIQRAVRYFYLQRHAFGGKVEGRSFGTATTAGGPLNLTDIEERLLEIHWRLKRVWIERLDACDCIKKYDREHTLFYVDPPYYETAGYAVPFGNTDFDRLNETLRAIKGKFILSLNDHPEVRRIFTGFKIKKVTLKYSTGRDPASRGKTRDEVLIQNF